MHLAVHLWKKPKGPDPSTQLTFLNRLARLLQRDHSMKQALEFLTFDPQLSGLSKQFVHYLEDGQSIEECFKRMQFQPLVISYLFFSGESGNMSEHIIHLHRLLTMKLEFETKLKKLLRYPVFLFAICILLFIVLQTFLLPLYERSFLGMGSSGSLPMYQLFLQLTETIFILFLVSAAIGTILLIHFHRRSSVEKKIAVYEKVPLYRGIFKMLITGQLSYQLAALLHSGKTIKESLLIIKRQSHMPFLQYFANQLASQLQRGSTLYHAFKDLPLVENEFKLLIKRGAEQGTLPDDLKNYTNLAIDSLEEKIKSTLMVIQPIVYVILGLMIILIYAFTLFPMFQMIGQL